MKISDWLKCAAQRIARRDAEWLLSQRLGVDKSFLVTHDDDDLGDLEAQLENDLQRREAGEPLAAIIGEQEFYGRKFWLGDGAVLIPRPESEAIVDICKELRPKSVLDIGTGSGCLAISVALELSESKVVAIDIDEQALVVARQNVKQLGADVEFRQNDLLSGWQGDLPEMIIANLPYVDENWGWLEKKALSHEPSRALYAADGGLELIKKLIDQVAVLSGGRWLLLEADPCQHETIRQYAQEKGLKFVRARGYILQFDLV